MKCVQIRAEYNQLLETDSFVAPKNLRNNYLSECKFRRNFVHLFRTYVLKPVCVAETRDGASQASDGAQQ